MAVFERFRLLSSDDVLTQSYSSMILCIALKEAGTVCHSFGTVASDAERILPN